jgi:hypothetical protein
MSEKCIQVSDRRKAIMRLMREDFDPHPNWELPAGQWDDNAEDVADKIEMLFAALRAQNAEIVAALEPFVALADKRDARYRKRGGNPDSFPDAHPSYDISAEKLELPMGAFRRARAALAAAGHKQGSGE